MQTVAATVIPSNKLNILAQMNAVALDINDPKREAANCFINTDSSAPTVPCSLEE